MRRKATTAAVVLALAAAPGAQAHRSAWTGHSQTRGTHWHLFYEDWHDEWSYQSGRCYWDHYHYVSHYYSPGDPYLYGYKHTNLHYVGSGSGCPTIAGQHGGGDAYVGVPATPVDPAGEIPDTQLSTEPESYRSTESPDQVATRLVARGLQAKFLLLTALAALGSIAIEAPMPDTVVTAVYLDDTDGTYVIETASPETARRMGH